MRRPPPGIGTSCRLVVVCLPAPSGGKSSRLEQRVVADERVHERRLADPGGSEQGCRRPGADELPYALDAVPRACGDEVDRDGASDILDLCCDRGGVVLEIGLRQQDDRLRSALQRERDVALQDERIELLAEGGRYEDNVDVCRDDLLAAGSRARICGGSAHERRSAGKDRLDDVGLERDPVADDRKRCGGRLAPEARRYSRANVALRSEHVVRAPMLHGDPRRRAPLASEPGEGIFPAFVPAERSEVRHTAIVPGVPRSSESWIEAARSPLRAIRTLRFRERFSVRMTFGGGRATTPRAGPLPQSTTKGGS